MKTIYLDNNATTAIAPEVHQSMLPFFTEEYFNPSSMYSQAQVPHKAIESAREMVAKALGGVDADQILFTSCATESNNNAILGVMKANLNRRHIITTSVEHPSVLEVCKDAQRQGYDVTFLPVTESGQIEIKDFIQALRPDTLLVTIMHANNETGVIFPVDELARITKETDPQIIFHTDATQTMGKLPINLRKRMQHIDMLSFSGHKLHAPKGVGALYIKRGTPCRPFILGGHQERGRRAGTENVAMIVALANACQLAVDEREKDIEHMMTLRDHLERELLERIPYVQVNGKNSPRLPNTLNISCHYVEGEGILYQLDEYHICASSGSACTSGSLDPSHVLKAMKVPFTAMHGSVRFSLSRYNTKEEIDKVIEVFPKMIENLRKISPYWDDVTNSPKINKTE